jgi:hypothetical protein
VSGRYCDGVVLTTCVAPYHLRLSTRTLESQFASPVSQMIIWSVMVSPPTTGAVVVSHPVEPPPVLWLVQ